MPHVSDESIPQPSDTERVVCRTASFTTEWPEPSTALVTCRGELDAANGLRFVAYALRHSDQIRWLVVDLSGLTFFNTAGFSALHTLNVTCVGENIAWALVPGTAVRRVLGICDPDSALPTQPDVASALTAVMEPPPSFQLIPKTG